MKKWEAIRYLEEKREEGYMTHSMLLELFDDNEEIPDEFLELACYIPEPPNTCVLYFGSLEGVKMFNQACEDFLRYLAQVEIKDDLVKKISKQ